MRGPLCSDQQDGGSHPGGNARPDRPRRRSRRAQRGVPRIALLVEADPVARRVCTATLLTSGYEVVSVESGIAAVAAARDTPPEIIVMDSQLPDVPWRVAMCWLRSNPGLRSTPILVLTARAIAGADLDNAQPLALVIKPVSAEGIREGMAAFRRR